MEVTVDTLAYAGKSALVVGNDFGDLGRCCAGLVGPLATGPARSATRLQCFEVAAKWNATPFDLNAEGMPEEMAALEFRQVNVAGEYDFDHQLVLQNQTLGTGTSSSWAARPAAIS